MDTIWTHTDVAGDQLDFDQALSRSGWTIWVLAVGFETVGVWFDRPALLALYHAIGDELRATGGCDLPAEPVT